MGISARIAGAAVVITELQKNANFDVNASIRGDGSCDSLFESGEPQCDAKSNNNGPKAETSLKRLKIIARECIVAHVRLGKGPNFGQ